MEPLPLGKEKMMSLSDETTQDFEPLDLRSLQAFEDEQAIKDKDPAVEPDLDRFKIFYEPRKLGEEEPDTFEFLYDFQKEIKKEDDIFSPIFEASQMKTRANAPVPPDDSKDQPQVSKDRGDEGSPKEPGYDKGFEKGQKEGYDKGFEKGKKEGFEKGRADGLVKGEAQGYDEGFEKGQADARHQVEKEAGQMLENLTGMLDETDRVHETLIDMYEEKILALVGKICEKVILDRIDTDDKMVGRTIIDAFRHLVEPEEVVLSVCEKDYEYIEMIKDDFFDQIGSLKNVSVQADSSVARGGCRIETGTAEISADPESKLAAVLDSIKDAGRET